ncbi:MAG TPA: GNAT family N-acetyltransferase [Pseudonocardiaceae bacterium]|nr:GNAT family N-acetyltransferase [Pseudonocardiaceae bacterium]
MRLRSVDEGDLEVYYRIYCDPAVMDHLGGVQPRDSIPEKLSRHAAKAANDQSWISMIVSDDPPGNAGIVSIGWHGGLAEIGWAVLPEYQGRGVGKAAVRLLLDRAAADGRWGVLHAFPGIDNGASNGICRSLGFTLLGEQDAEFAGKLFRGNHWVIDPTAT